VHGKTPINIIREIVMTLLLLSDALSVARPPPVSGARQSTLITPSDCTTLTPQPIASM
jgi:hypothetical protein